MTVRFLETIDNQTFDLPVFATKAYMQTCSSTYGWLCSENCLLPIVIHKRYIFKYATCTNEVVYTGAEVSENEEIAFLDEAMRVLKRMKIDFITTPQTNAVFRCAPSGAKVCQFGTYIIDLTKSETELFDALHSKHRNSIRKAQKDGVVVKQGFDLQSTVYQNIDETQKRSHISFLSPSEFEKHIAVFGDDILLFASFLDDKCQGSAVLLKDSKQAYYVYGGSCVSPHQGAVGLLQWEAIRFCKNSGIQHYNFVGARVNPDESSRAYGIKKFKQRFGGEFVTGYLWKYTNNPFKKKMFDVLIRLKTGKPNRDIIDEEAAKN